MDELFIFALGTQDVLGPIVDGYFTKRKWVIYTQLTIICCLLCLAFSLQLTNFFFTSLLILGVTAFISATFDIAADGFYMLALTAKDQAMFVGIRSVFYRLATIFALGIVVVLAGQFEEVLGITLSWTLAIALSALILSAFLVFHWLTLPNPNADVEKQTTISVRTFYFKVVKSYFSQQKIWAILAFILLYRFGEAMLVKLSAPFLLDPTELGGLGLSTSDVGLIYGTVGTITLVLGGVLGEY